jgi:flagellar motor protein MotB
MSDTGEHSEGRKHKKHGPGGHGGGHEEGHEGAPEWLISFADMVMLMMGFFVILFALNVQPVGRMPGGTATEQTGAANNNDDGQLLDLAISVRAAFNNPVNINSSNPNDAALVRRLRQRAGKSETRDPGIKGHEQDVQAIRPSDYYAISGSINFAENSTELSASGQRTIDEVAKKLKGLRLVVEVRGHASSVEAARGTEQSMELSSDRALEVARALAAQGVDWWQMRLVICADHDRLQAYPQNRAADKANARVEIVITDQVVPDQVPTRYTDPGASADGSGAFVPYLGGG